MLFRTDNPRYCTHIKDENTLPLYISVILVDDGEVILFSCTECHEKARTDVTKAMVEVGASPLANFLSYKLTEA